MKIRFQKIRTHTWWPQNYQWISFRKIIRKVFRARWWAELCIVRSYFRLFYRFYDTLLKDVEYDYIERENELTGNIMSIYRCRYQDCTREFNRAWNLLNHANMHKGCRPFPCQIWDHSFTQKGNLKKHQMTHLMPELKNRKRYIWKYWGKGYTEKYNYRVSFLLSLASAKRWMVAKIVL